MKNGKMQGFLPEELDEKKFECHRYEQPPYGIGDREFFEWARYGKIEA